MTTETMEKILVIIASILLVVFLTIDAVDVAKDSNLGNTFKLLQGTK